MEKAYRIKKNTEIEEILKGKNSVGNKYYVIYIKKNHETNHFRLGMSVSKKIGNAVVRNREKRRIKHVFLSLKDSLLPYDIFVIERANSLNLEFSEITKEIKYLLKKKNVIKKIGEENEKILK